MDSSVWIDHFRGRLDLPHVRRLGDAQRAKRVAVGDLILLEVLQGAPDEARATKIERVLRSLRVVRLLDDDLAVLGASHARRLRALGVTLRASADLIIGTWCIARGVPLLHNDRDFDAMERHLGLPVAVD